MSVWCRIIASRMLCGLNLFFGLFMVGCTVSEPPKNVVRPVKTAIATQASQLVVRNYPAVVLPTRQAELAFKVAGRIIELPIRAAAEVKEGDTIAQLDQQQFQTTVKRLESQLDQANAQLAQMRAGARDEDLAKLRSEVKAAESQMEKQQKQVERIRQLRERDAVSQAELEDELATLKTKVTAFDVAEQELKKAEAGERNEVIEAQEAAIRGLKTQLEQAEVELEETTLMAPFDGVVASRNVDNFATVQANAVIATLQSLERIDLEFDIPGADVARFGKQIDARSIARLDAAPGREFEVEFVEFGTQADAATQTFRGRLSIAYPDDFMVLPGMTGSIVIEIPQESDGQLSIPESALAGGEEGAFVWVVDREASTVDKRKVKVSALMGDTALIDGEVSDGDTVVTAGISFLRQGMSVKLIEGEE